MANKDSVPREELVTKLIEENRNFHRLYKDHKELESKLTLLNGKRHLSDEDELERKRIQKLKLQRKDQMEQLILQAFQQNGSIG